MKLIYPSIIRKIYGLALLFAVLGAFAANTQAAKVGATLASKLNNLTDNAAVGMAIIAFNSNNGLQESHLNVLRSIGITGGQTFQKLGMVAQPLTAGQVRALAANSAVRSITLNDKLYYTMHQARVLAGVDRARIDTGFIMRNGGLPVDGTGNFSVMVIDSGVDATHADLQFGTKVVQNVQTLVGAGTLPGFTPNVSLENVPNTDQSVGHGTHCAGIIGGSGIRSGGTYAGVAPGAKIIGAGLGAGLFVLNAIAAWEWALVNQTRYNIRVVSNSYGGGGDFDPDNAITIATKAAYDRNIAVVFAGGNSGPTKNTYNPYAKAPWVIGVAAGTKEGLLADFSSRGTPRAERLANETTLDDFDAPVITAPGTGRAVEANAARFTSAMVSTRSTVNLTANGLNADADLPAAAIPFYTQISGTSMATPFVAGTIALMLDADPTLSVDEIREILTATASKMPGYEDYEVGSGYINSYAAVDKVFNRSRNYVALQDSPFNATFGEERPAAQNFHIDFNPAFSGPTSTNAKTFTVEPGMNVLDVFANVDTIAEEGTGNPVGIRLTSPSGARFSGGIDLPVIGSSARQVVVENPEAGVWTLEVRGVSGLAAAPVSSPQQAGVPGPVDGTVTQIKYILPEIADLNGHAFQSEIEFAIKNRVIDIFADGSFRPNQVVTREDFARSLVLNAPLRQTVTAAPKFTDVTGDLLAISTALTANGSTLRDYNFTPKGLMSATGANFNPNGTVSRIETAIALVRALGRDGEAVALAGTNVTVGGSTIADNAQIPSALRGYVQIALNSAMFETFPPEIREIAPGQFVALPGPRFEPNTIMRRGTLAMKLNAFHTLFGSRL